MKEDNKDSKELLENKIQSQVVEVQSNSSKNANNEGQETDYSYHIKNYFKWKRNG